MGTHTVGPSMGPWVQYEYKYVLSTQYSVLSTQYEYLVPYKYRYRTGTVRLTVRVQYKFTVKLGTVRTGRNILDLYCTL